MRIFTIGYEATTMGDFLAALRQAGVERVIDVRLVIAAEGSGAGREVHACQRPIEMQSRTRGFCGVDQGEVEIAAADGPDHFGVVAAVALRSSAGAR